MTRTNRKSTVRVTPFPRTQTRRKKVNFMRDQAPQTSPDVPGRRTFPIFSFHNPDVSALYEPNSLFAQSGLPSFSPVSTEKENDGVLTQKESNASRRSPQPDGVESRQSPRRTKSAAGRKEGPTSAPFRAWDQVAKRARQTGKEI